MFRWEIATVEGCDQRVTGPSGEHPLGQWLGITLHHPISRKMPNFITSNLGMVTMAVYQTNDVKTKHGNIIMMGYFAVSCIQSWSQPAGLRAPPALDFHTGRLGKRDVRSRLQCRAPGEWVNMLWRRDSPCWRMIPSDKHRKRCGKPMVQASENDLQRVDFPNLCWFILRYNGRMVNVSKVVP